MSVQFEKFECPCCDDIGYSLNMDPEWIQKTDEGVSYVMDHDEAMGLYMQLKEALIYDA